MKYSENPIPKVNVIIPNFNQGQFLIEAIESVIDQTYKNIQIIICDDCSTDDSVELVIAFVKKRNIQNLTLLQNDTNQGVSYSRNRAIENATGSLVALLDADDRWVPEKIEKQVTELEANPHAGICFTAVSVFASEEYVQQLKSSNKIAQDIGHWERSYNALFKKPRPKRKWDKLWLLLTECDVCFSSLMIRKDVFSKVGGFQKLEYQAEDLLFKYSGLFVSDLCGINERLTEYRCHPESYSQRVFNLDRDSERLGADLTQATLIVRRKLIRFIWSRLLTKADIWNTSGLTFFVAKRVMLKLWRKSGDIYRAFVNKYLRNLEFTKSKKLDLLIFFTTSACNLSCRMCFYADNLNTDTDLSFERTKKIISTAPNSNLVLITGGEPFMNKRIGDQVLMFLEKSSVSVNTNGTYSKRTIQTVRHILEEHYSKKDSSNQFNVALSLDGLEETHNKIRQADCFKTTLNTISGLIELQDKYRHFSVQINTVITTENYKEMLPLAAFIKSNFNVCYHNFEIERSNPDSADGAQIEDAELMVTLERLLQFVKLNYPSSYSMTRARYSIEYLNKTQGKLWPFPCTAGEKSLVIFEDGRVNSCEMLPDVGRMEDFDDDVRKVLSSAAMKKRRSQIKADRCDCSHGCWVLSSMKDHSETNFGNVQYDAINKGVLEIT